MVNTWIMRYNTWIMRYNTLIMRLDGKYIMRLDGGPACLMQTL